MLSLKLDTTDFLGTGMMTAIVRKEGICFHVAPLPLGSQKISANTALKNCLKACC